MKVQTRYTFEPAGWDLYRPTANAPEQGAVVVKVQPYGCPRNGTMGHTYVKREGAPDHDFALVLLNSLRKIGATS